MEKWDVYDINRQRTGKFVDENGCFKKDMYRVVIHICIFNSKGQLLIQKRSATKKNFPNTWDITLGGKVQFGETSQQGAERELFEELYIKHDFSKERPLLTINFPNGFDDYYVIENDIDIKNVKFFDNEVQQVKWATLEEVLDLIRKGNFIRYYESFITSLFEMRKGKGVFNV